jgi:hypothetical protein
MNAFRLRSIASTGDASPKYLRHSEAVTSERTHWPEGRGARVVDLREENVADFLDPVGASAGETKQPSGVEALEP